MHSLQARLDEALAQLQQIIAAVRPGAGPDPAAPATLNATVEVDVGVGSIVARRWTRHPLCGCWYTSLTESADQG